MNKNYYLLFIVFFTSIVTLCAQSSYSISGFVTDNKSEPIQGVSIYLNTGKGVETNKKGHYQISDLKPGKYEIAVALVGFEKIIQKMDVKDADVKINFVLEDSINNLDQVTISSTKKITEINLLPKVISSKSNKFLEGNNITQLDEIAAFVPGLQVLTQNPNVPSIAIRGISTEDSQSSSVPRVSTLRDGIYLGKSRGSIVEVFDVESVDVYKGPQISTFGKGIQSGAIDIVQNKAKNIEEGRITVGAGAFESKYINGVYNVPIVKDKLLARVAGIYDFQEGYVKSFSNENYSGKETLALKVALRYIISENTILDVIGNYQKDTPPTLGYKSALIGQSDANVNPFGPLSLNSRDDGGVDRTVLSGIAILNHKFSGKWKGKANIGYRNYDSVDVFDIDGSPAPAAGIKEIAIGKQLSSELKITFENTAVKANLGTHFLYEDTSQEVDVNVNEQSLFVTLLRPSISTIFGQVVSVPNIPEQIFEVNLATVDPRLAPLIGLPLQSFNTEKGRNFSENYTADIFGDISAKFLDKIEVGIGLRGSWEEINGILNTGSSLTPSPIGALTGVGTNIAFEATNGEESLSDSFLSYTGNAFVKYNFTEEINSYFNISKGRNPNIIAFDEDTPKLLDAEEIISYEFGSKLLLFDKKLQINGAIFYYDYSNFRTPVFDGDSQTLSFSQQDSGQATVKGGEIEARYVFGKKSSVFANYSHLDTSFDDTDENGEPLEFAGKQFRQTPKNSFSLGGNFQTRIDDRFDYYLRPIYSFKSRVFYTSSNDNLLSQPEFGILNLNTGIILDKGIEISLFMKNVFDKQYLIDAGNIGNSFGIPTYVVAQPRFYGFRLGYSF